MAFEKGQYVVLKNDHNNPYSKETLVNIYGIIPEKLLDYLIEKTNSI